MHVENKGLSQKTATLWSSKQSDFLFTTPNVGRCTANKLRWAWIPRCSPSGPSLHILCRAFLPHTFHQRDLGNLLTPKWARGEFLLRLYINSFIEPSEFVQLTHFILPFKTMDLCSLGCPQTHHGSETDFKVLFFQSLPPDCQDDMCLLSYPALWLTIFKKCSEQVERQHEQMSWPLPLSSPSLQSKATHYRIVE